MAIQTAIGETVRAGSGLSSITPKNDRVIRTEVVQMSDGRIHGVHVWIGPPDMEPPDRPVPGPLIWDLTSGTATDTTESLLNSGWDPDSQITHGRAFAEDLPKRDLNPSEAQVLSMAIKREPGQTLCNSWDVTDHRGEPITVGFVARVLAEEQDDGSQRLILPGNELARRTRGRIGATRLPGTADPQRPGPARCVSRAGRPDELDAAEMARRPGPVLRLARQHGRRSRRASRRPCPDGEMAEEFATGTASGVLRMVANDGGWTPVHVTVNRVELEEDVYAGLATLRLPSDEELASTQNG